MSLLSTLVGCYFYPRPPRGGRPKRFMHRVRQQTFLSTPSARRATVAIGVDVQGVVISIHALREEGDLSVFQIAHDAVISIHALREEGDTDVAVETYQYDQISIHALREEGDHSWWTAGAIA